jgi:hypothetical protein
MQRFAIFKKTNKFYWSKNRIIYSLAFLCIGIFYLNSEVLKIEIPKTIGNWFAGLIGVGFFVLIIIMILGFSKPDPLRGKLEGFIAFKENAIEVGDEEFSISEIQNIHIANEDYYGKTIARGKGNFNSPLSNGVDNTMTLTFKSNDKKKYDFEVYYSDDFQKVRNELINYFKLGKITFENLCEVLGEKTKSEIAELKKEIENISTTANTR